MNCKHCGAEIDASANVCPECGKPQETERKQVGVGKIIAATAICVVLLFFLAVAVIYGITGELPYLDKLVNNDPTGAPTHTSGTDAAPGPITPAELGMAIENITDIESFLGEDDAVIAAGDTVVARVGNVELTNSQLQVAYWMEVYGFANDNSSYLSYYGLDLTKPMDEQYVMDSDITWEQYFLDIALQSWHRYAMLNVLAEQAGFQPGEEFEKSVNEITSNLREMAELNKFATVEELLAADMGVGATEKAYVEYMKQYYLAMEYVDELYLNTELSREEVEKYFDEHAAEISSQYGITKESGILADVRHVLVQPEGATTDASGYIIATDEQWEACRVAAQKMLDDWVAAGAKEEDFAAMAKEHSVDGGSSANGGLYQYVSAGQMVANFNDWLFAEGRKAGDYGLVKTEFGYHLMYYVGGDQAWYLYGKDLAQSGFINDTVENGVKEFPMDVELDKMVLGMAKALLPEETPTESTAPTATGAAQ